MIRSDTISTSAVTVSCTSVLTPARSVSTVTTPPATDPRLHKPCNRFITGV